MKSLALLLLATCAGGAASGEPAADPGLPPTAIRRELLSEFRYSPPPTPPAPVPAVLTAAPAAGESGDPDPGVLRMDPFTVRESVKMETLHAVLMKEKSDARTAQVMSRLGIGLHVKAVGPVAVYAATIFYIPFAVGAAISF